MLAINDQDDLEKKAYKYYIDFQNDPTNLDIALVAISQLKEARLDEELGEVVDIAHKSFPNHLHIQLNWAKFPLGSQNLAEALFRLKLCSQYFLPNQGDGLLFITEQFILLRDMEKWDELVALIDQNWTVIRDTKIWIVVSAIVFTLSACGLHQKLIEFIDCFLQKTDFQHQKISGIVFSNMKTIAMAAISNNEWRKSLPADVKILSIGQNCLPSTLAGRWGLVDDPLNFLPFDQSAFPGSSISVALDTDFADFEDEGAFIARPFSRTACIAYHKSTGVHFAHNPLPLKHNSQALQDVVKRFKKRILKFKQEVASAKSICFFVNICGDCQIEELVDSICKRFGADANVFILNTTHTRIDQKWPKNFTYLHSPYPSDYGWNTLDDYTTDRGIAFESHIIESLKRKIRGM